MKLAILFNIFENYSNLINYNIGDSKIAHKDFIKVFYINANKNKYNLQI